MLINIQNVRTWIRQSLGSPVVCVETTDEQIDQTIEDAFLWFGAYRGWYRETAISILSGQPDYDLSAVDPEVSDVMKVWFTQDPRLDMTRIWGGFLDVDGVPWDDFGQEQDRGGLYSGIVQLLQTREIASRVLSANRDWEFNIETKVLHVSPADMMSGKAIVLYATPFKKEYLPLVPAEYAFLIREYALARTKYILGRIRGKYSGGLPAAQGNVSLDGGDLIQEAQSDFERLEQKLLDLMPPPGIIIG